MITNYVGATLVATVSPAWATEPSNDSQFYIYQMEQGTGNANVISWLGTAAATPTVRVFPKWTLHTWAA